jgi:phage terminase large subunit
VTTRPESHFDFRNPDYGPILQARMDRLAAIRQDPALLAALKVYYRDHPAEFITDWGVTYDPRNIERGLPAAVPFILFPKQREWVEWVVARWRGQEPGVTEKTRDMGMSWLSIAFACTMCLFHEGLTFGFGSRKEEYVDKLGHPKSLFYKARLFMEHLPPEFLGGWTRDHAPHMRISFPGTKSVLTGEAGDNIGRGDRAAIYFVDEAAFLERPQLVEASLSATTNCRIDISTPNGRANPFADKRFRFPSERVFRFHWRDDPRKDDAWYAKQIAELDPVTVAQEIDINYSASVEGVLIPSEWVQSAIDADKKLGLSISGRKRAALDVADEGADKNALACATGIRLDQVSEWSGVGSDILQTVAKAFNLCDQYGTDDLRFDSDGLGAGVRGDARSLNEQRETGRITVTPWRGSAKVAKPDKAIPTAQPTGRKDRTNGDFFKNAKAQGGWELRVRFQRTHRAVTEPDYQYDPDDLIVLNGSMPNLDKLTGELSQPTYSVDTTGKVVIDKAPDGTRSPNLYDSAMILFAPRQGGAYDLAKALDG